MLWKKYVRFFWSAMVRRRVDEVGLAGSESAVRDAHVPHDAQDVGDGLAGIAGLFGGVDVEAGEDEPISRAVCSGEHDRSADVLPAGVECELFLEDRRVGQELLVVAVVYNEFAADLLENCGVAGVAGVAGGIGGRGGPCQLLQRVRRW